MPHRLHEGQRSLRKIISSGQLESMVPRLGPSVEVNQKGTVNALQDRQSLTASPQGVDNQARGLKSVRQVLVQPSPVGTPIELRTPLLKTRSIVRVDTQNFAQRIAHRDDRPRTPRRQRPSDRRFPGADRSREEDTAPRRIACTDHPRLVITRARRASCTNLVPDVLLRLPQAPCSRWWRVPEVPLLRSLIRVDRH